MNQLSKINLSASFVPINNDLSSKRIAEVTQRLRVLERAGENGQRNEPPSDDRDPDEIERNLHAESQSFIQALRRHIDAGITERVNEAAAKMPKRFNLRLERANSDRQIKETKSVFEAELEKALTYREEKWSKLRRFEEEHRLPSRSASYGHDRPMFYTRVGTLVLLEGVANSALLAPMQQNGLIGGFGLAVGASLANVAMGYGAGAFGLRFLRHLKRVKRLLGLAVTAGLVTAGVALHLALAHLREAIAANPHANIDFLVILKPGQWFDFTTVPPAVLFAIGIATFAIATLKGQGVAWGVISTYPGHDAEDRAFRTAQWELDDAIENLRSAVLNAFDAEREKLRDRLDADRAQLAEIREIVLEANSAARTLGDSVRDELGRLHIWLRAYRDRNGAVRTTPGPDYFDRFPTLENAVVVRPDLSELTDLLARAEKIVDDNTATLAKLEEKTLADQIALLDELTREARISEKRGAGRVVRVGQSTLKPKK